PSLGLVAAAEVGVALERFPLVAGSRADWPAVTAALLDAVDVVLLCPPPHVRASDARRLRARARERGAVLVTTGASTPDADVRLTMTGASWKGWAGATAGWRPAGSRWWRRAGAQPLASGG